jgi:hypothetical protein
MISAQIQLHHLGGWWLSLSESPVVNGIPLALWGIRLQLSKIPGITGLAAESSIRPLPKQSSLLPQAPAM